MKIKVSDYVVEFLKQKGAAFVFEMSGGMIAHLLDSLGQVEEVKVISMHHEQGAAFAADACGRMTGVPGVAVGELVALKRLRQTGHAWFDASGLENPAFRSVANLLQKLVLTKAAF